MSSNQWIGINNDEIIAEDFSHSIEELVKPMSCFISVVFIDVLRLLNLDLKDLLKTSPTVYRTVV